MSTTLPQAIAMAPPKRILVHNPSTTVDIEQGSVVKLTGTFTDEKPNVEKTASNADRAIGVAYEDIKAGKDGIVVVDGIVWVRATGTVTAGEYAMPASDGQATNIDLADPATGGKTVSQIGTFLSGITGGKAMLFLDRAVYRNYA